MNEAFKEVQRGLVSLDQYKAMLRDNLKTLGKPVLAKWMDMLEQTITDPKSPSDQRIEAMAAMVGILQSLLGEST